MKKNQLYIILITIIMSLFSCKKVKEDAIYVYGTPEFETKSKELKYSLNNAVNIYCKYAFEEQKQDSIWFYMDVIYDDNYVFTTLSYNLKTGYRPLKGYWVNGKTGELRKEESDKYVDVLIKQNGAIVFMSKKQFEKNGRSVFEKKEQPNQPEIYTYGTPGFNIKVSELKYNLENAIDIYLKYVFEKLNADSIIFYTNSILIHGNDYIFSTKPYNTETEVYTFGGYGVNGETGEMKKIEEDQLLKVVLEDFGSVVSSDNVMTKKQYEQRKRNTFNSEE